MSCFHENHFDHIREDVRPPRIVSPSFPRGACFLLLWVLRLLRKVPGVDGWDGWDGWDEGDGWVGGCVM